MFTPSSVDDVLCLSKRSYLEGTLLPALKLRYKISHEMMSGEGDELTFLKRHHMLVNEFELAIQSHPKHLEKLFELLKIGRGLELQKTPVHPMLDEDDNGEPLDSFEASVYRSCIGILLYVSSDLSARMEFVDFLSGCPSLQNSPWSALDISALIS